MKRLIAGIAFAALSLAILMLLGRIVDLRRQIAELHRERPRVALSQDRGAIRVDGPAIDQAPEPIVREERPANEHQAIQPAELAFQRSEVTPFVELRDTPAREEPPPQAIVIDMPFKFTIGSGTQVQMATEAVLTYSLKLADPVDQLELSEFQRERIAALKAQRDAEEEAVRNRWEHIIQGELTPEQLQKVRSGRVSHWKVLER